MKKIFTFILITSIINFSNTYIFEKKHDLNFKFSVPINIQNPRYNSPDSEYDLQLEELAKKMNENETFLSKEPFSAYLYKNKIINTGASAEIDYKYKIFNKNNFNIKSGLSITVDTIYHQKETKFIINSIDHSYLPYADIVINEYKRLNPTFSENTQSLEVTTREKYLDILANASIIPIELGYEIDSQNSIYTGIKIGAGINKTIAVEEKSTNIIFRELMKKIIKNKNNFYVMNFPIQGYIGYNRDSINFEIAGGNYLNLIKEKENKNFEYKYKIENDYFIKLNIGYNFNF